MRRDSKPEWRAEEDARFSQDTLERTSDLQDRFEKALNHLFDPSQ